MATDTLVNDLQNGTALLSLLGSFWNGLYADGGLTEGFATARSRAERQSYRDVCELVSSVSRLTVPIYHRKNWKLFTFRQSDVTYADDGSSASVPHDGLEDFAGASLVVNRLTDPTVAWHDGVEFVVEGDDFIFAYDPFDEPRVAKRSVFGSDGIEEDVEADLWVFNGDFDWELAYEQFGYVLNVHLASAENYRDLLNALFDAVQFGTARSHVEALVCALADVPMVREPVETVEAVFTDRRGLVVATDLNVYRFSSQALPTVGVGDVVRAGDSLTNAVEVIEFTNGEVPNSLTAVSLSGSDGHLTRVASGPIKWRNATVPTTVIEGVDGKTYIRWELGGDSADVTQFWTDVHANGVASGTSLADLMDLRTNQVGEPAASNLPAEINPLEWLVANVLRYNAFVVLARSDALGANSLGVDGQEELFRKAVPPHTALFLQTLTKYNLEHDAVAVLMAQVIKSHDSTAVLQATTTLAHGADVYLAPTLSHGATAVLLATTTLAHGADAVIGQSVLAHGATAVLKATATKSHSADAALIARIVLAHGATAVLKSTATKAHGVDARLV